MNLKRAAAVAAILLLALPSAALADDAGTDGVILNGTNLVTLVNGQDAPGAISVRFADDPTYALFYENDSYNGVTPTAPGEFAIHEGGVPYSSDNGNYTVGAAPVQSGSGTVMSPWVVSSGFSTPDLGIAQKISHVNGSRALTLTWRSPTPPAPASRSARSGAPTSTSPAATRASARSFPARRAPCRASRSTAPRPVWSS
jgi:hypothetical protein